VVSRLPEPNEIAFAVCERDGLDLIEPLWQGLAAHHRERARERASAFLGEMEAKTFAARRAELLEKNRDRALRVELAVDPATGEPVGYCIASAARGCLGEVESIFVADTHRDCGIGGALLDHALAWMDGIGTVEQATLVSAGNDRALPFYERHRMRWQTYGGLLYGWLVENRTPHTDWADPGPVDPEPAGRPHPAR
jgi:GNAT superfamily N-acetyltransferase